MVSSAPSSSARSPLVSSSASLSSRPLLAKSLRRLARSFRSEARLLLSRSRRRGLRPLPLVLLLLFIVALVLVSLRLWRRLSSSSIFRELGQDRETTHFTKNVHLFLPRQPDFDSAALHACSWLYLEFGAKDGRHLDGFFANGNGFLEEFLRGTQSSMRGFCALAFDGNPTMEQLLLEVRKVRGRKAFRFNVYAGVVPGKFNATEKVQLVSPDDPATRANVEVQSIAVPDTVSRLTLPWAQSGKEVPHMNTPRGNGNLGAVVVRFNVENVAEAYWHLDLLETYRTDGLLCDRVDRLILDLRKMPLIPTNIAGDMDDSDVHRAWERLITPPVSPQYDPKNGVLGLVRIANEVNGRKGCRTTIHVIDETGKMLSPSLITERDVFYAILAGQPTFDERISAQTESWMTAVPQDRLTIFTNKPRNNDEMKAARGRDTVVTKPHVPSLEQRLPLMQSWSHLVRVRESWDRTMKHNKDIKWLALVDDDTFVFPGGMREYLSKFDPRVQIWGGSGEQARIDNGDGGKFGIWLRDLNKKHGGKHCYFPKEDIPKNLRGSHVEYGISQVLNGRKVAHKVSHMCGDMFCRMGCPAVPQGAAIVLSRALVEALRPHIERCERDTSGLCKNCGSQRLYMCVNRYAGATRTLLTRGICRAPWKLEHREKFPFVLTFHGFNRYHGMALSTDSLHGDMMELWQLGKRYEESVKHGVRSSYLVRMQDVANLIGCHGQGQYRKGECITPEGIKIPATDGKRRSPMKMDGQRPSDRKGSA